ncbi:hypothetical protein A5482_004230 [Cyanobacterium sp. IPPAS B-1200]|uniref:hypothetical protein n=1 Tax=Cyanobacterium sp. IPPAS B-1200 TaxID=1562720 RepID=UPI0008525238|nr:hypothetical protein [Cyanobacterium sp. IPPAS B-1200]OEJ79869.1 hypothetical protein A5482_08385 [Cyanobacterium sp. IPPAS B-1200]
MNLIATKDISFESAIALTQEFINQLPTLEEDKQEEIVTSLVQSVNGSRGFFVTYLTHENQLVDNPSNGVIKGLKSAPEIVSELLVKNIAMSTAMKITHMRNNDSEMAESSQKVTQRTKKIVELCQLEQVKNKLSHMKNTIIDKEGEYQEFLLRWGYDDEQKQAILESVQG